MNDKMQNFARKFLLDGLETLPEGYNRTFKLMYGRNNGKRSVEDTEKMSIDAVVEEITPEKLDWAMQQVERSIAKLAKKEAPDADKT
jgi:5-methylthioribose kinase